MGNPFLEEINDLLVLDTNDIMESAAVTARKVETIGQEQYSKFVDERLSKCVAPVSDPLPKKKRALFSRPAVKAPSKGKLQLQSMKSDCNLFSRQYLACQGRDGDVDQFFSQENHACPCSNFDYIRMDISEQHANMKDIPSQTVTCYLSAAMLQRFMNVKLFSDKRHIGWYILSHVFERTSR